MRDTFGAEPSHYTENNEEPGKSQASRNLPARRRETAIRIQVAARHRQSARREKSLAKAASLWSNRIREERDLFDSDGETRLPDARSGGKASPQIPGRFVP